jgi:cytoskeletal protein CcmA (bactofilin family)
MSHEPSAMSSLRGAMVALAIVVCGGAPWAEAAVRGGDTVVVEGAVNEDLYAAGGTVDIDGEVRGDVVAAGGRVTVQQRVQGDVTASGGEVILLGDVGDDVRAAGGQVSLEGQVAGDAMAAGGRVMVAPGARIGGAAWLAGGRVEVAGRVANRLRAAGRVVRIGGQVDGNVEVAALELEVLPGARIAGALSYRSPDPARIDPTAQIGGPVRHRPSQVTDRLGQLARIIFWVMGLMLLLSLVVAGAVLLLLFPDVTARAGATIATDPGKSLGIGLLVFLGTPLLVGFLMITILGIPLGLGVGALYVLWLLLGLLAAIVFLGDLGVRLTRRSPSRGWRLLFFLVALLLLGLLQGIPVVGSLLLFLGLLLGTGAWSLQVMRRYRGVAAGG